MAETTRERKRQRMPKPRPDTLEARWANTGEASPGDIAYAYGDGTRKADSHLLHNMLYGDHVWNGGDRRHSFVEELKRRGYDLTTLRFIIKKAPRVIAPEGDQ